MITIYYLLFIIFFILIIIFIPIKVPIKISCTNNSFNIYIYKMNIFPLKKKKKRGHNKSKLKKERKLKIQIPSFINSILNNKYKPKFKFDTKLAYSTGDSAITAELFGIINIVLYFIADLIGLIFYLSEKNIEINPIFSDEFNLETELNCILYINITQIIFIGILVLKNIEFKGGTR